MANEIELKLALPKSAQALLLRQSALRKATSKTTHQLVNLYYDTPGLVLHKRGIALRLRKRGRIWLQTVKSAGSSAVGLTTRPEWESPYAGHFDFAAIEPPALRRWLGKPSLRRQITPLFETNFKRTTWRFEPHPGCVLLLMLDRGWIASAGRLEEISEVEIELGGDADDSSIVELFKLAQSLGERLPLMPATLSKAERGYRLYQGLPLSPQKAAPVPLARDDSPIEAFRKVALAGLEHLQGNLQGAVRSNDPEFIHQMRVATRRLRAALRVFAPLLPVGLAEGWVPELRSLTTRLGQARDLDVLLTEIVTPVMRALPGEPRLAALAGAITGRQHGAREQAVRHLQSIGHGRLVLQATSRLHQEPFLAAILPIGKVRTAIDPTETVADFAQVRIKRLYKRVLRLVASAAVDDPVSLHRLRIGIKRLRYALEFFAPLGAAKSLGRLLATLVKMQDDLGQLNDLANAGVLLMSCAGDDSRLREAVSLVGGWHASRHSGLLKRIPEQLRMLERMSLPRLN